MIVVDASALLEVLLNTPDGTRVAARLFGADETLHAPNLLDLEVSQVLRRYERTGQLDSTRGRQAIDDLLDFPLTRYSHDVLLPRIWELRHNLTVYDAAYLALGEALGAPVVTRDAALAAAPTRGVRIELI